MGTLRPRPAAWASMAVICCLFPSTRKTRWRTCSGSRRPASSNAAAIMSSMDSVMEAETHLSRACGPGCAVRRAGGAAMPSGVILAALELAASRGVDVRLLISEKNDHPWLVTVGRSYYGQLLAAGVRIFEYSVGINHAKIMLADDQWAMVGSANLDYRSMRLNFELNLLFHSAERNGELAWILEHDFGLCREIDQAAFARRPFRTKFLEAALRPLSPML